MLVDARNFDAVAPLIIKALVANPYAGFDIETQDSARHAGLVAITDRRKRPIDFRRSVVTGFSVSDGIEAWYINLAHADVANRVPWEKARQILDAFEGTWVIHNAPFELVMMKNALDYDIKNYVCTLQMAVSAYNSDEYPTHKIAEQGLGGMTAMVRDAARLFQGYDGKAPLTEDQEELLTKVIAKESDASHSYNGYVGEMAFGYSLKQAVKSWFGVQMTTYEQVLNGKDHMGELTGEEVAAYGADDSLWCLRLFFKLLQFITENRPKVLETYFKQELPMVELYAETKRHGLKIDAEAVAKAREVERSNYAAELRKLKTAIKALLPFPKEHSEPLKTMEKWYRSNPDSYRNKITKWASLADTDDDFKQCTQVKGAVPDAWAKDRGVPSSATMNLTHYMVMRTIFYDLIGTKLILADGKVQSDKETRERIAKRFAKLEKNEGLTWDEASAARHKACVEVLRILGEMSSVDQRMKLYLNPYTNLIDPETGRVYPDLNSMLASRRLAMQKPNGMQLQKRGTSTYVRGFYHADNPTHLVVSHDWSQVELVLIGDQSGDPEFKKAYGQTPYEDLHVGAAADVLEMTVAEFKAHERYKDLRTEVGKGSNFNYWYSGALWTVGQKMGWSPDQTWEATERYRQRFAVAEAWRVETIDRLRRDGYLELPDGHLRVKYEATSLWQDEMLKLWQDAGAIEFGRLMTKKIMKRAGNQGVNSKIQGSCATLAKRSAVDITRKIRADGFDARFMMPIHDELVHSVNVDQVLDFIPMVKGVMTHHPEIVKDLVLDCTASVGRTFEPYHPDRAPFGQIELDELPALPFVPKDMIGKKADRAMMAQVVEYLRG